MASRSETKFFLSEGFKKAVRGFGPGDAAVVLDDITKFQYAWHNSTKDDELPPRYKFKRYKGVHRSYQLHQIYVGPNRKHLSYRAVVMFYDELANACWIHAFKKERMSEPQEVELALARADDYWNTLKER